MMVHISNGMQIDRALIARYMGTCLVGARVGAGCALCGWAALRGYELLTFANQRYVVILSVNQLQRISAWGQRMFLQGCLFSAVCGLF